MKKRLNGSVYFPLRAVMAHQREMGPEPHQPQVNSTLDDVATSVTQAPHFTPDQDAAHSAEGSHSPPAPGAATTNSPRILLQRSCRASLSAN